MHSSAAALLKVKINFCRKIPPLNVNLVHFQKNEKKYSYVNKKKKKEKT